VPPPALVNSGLSWRNAAYAFQWWIFALFAGYMWWRMVRDDFQDSHYLDTALAPVDVATTKA
jgi:surfeit locus 1 family protein